MYKSPKYTKQMLQIIKTFRAEWSGLRKKAEQQAATIPHPPLPLTFINNVMFHHSEDLNEYWKAKIDRKIEDS